MSDTSGGRQTRGTAEGDLGRWSREQAKAWADAQGWLIGANYIPANAINQLEMWQAATFDPKRIDLELGWAEALGINAVRVFLHNALWDEDSAGFKGRIGRFLEIAVRRHIKTMLVLFDSCWDPDPRPGPQRLPIPGVHNSGWVQAPGAAILDDPGKHPRLKSYVEGIVATFRNDPGVLAWDVWNEPDNPGGRDYADRPKDKIAKVATLLPQVFSWSRGRRPTQPLTSGLWQGSDWSFAENLNDIQKIQLSRSDIVTFHNYDWPEGFERRVHELEPHGRPILCTEYLARGNGSMLDEVLPLGKKLGVGMINWGFVSGKTQTILPWDSWYRPYTREKPAIWFHDLLHEDGTPYREREARIIRSLTGAAQTEHR